MPTKVEGVGGGVTISRTGENWGPRDWHSTIMGVLEEEDRQPGRDGEVRGGGLSE